MRRLTRGSIASKSNCRSWPGWHRTQRSSESRSVEDVWNAAANLADNWLT